MRAISSTSCLSLTLSTRRQHDSSPTSQFLGPRAIAHTMSTANTRPTHLVYILSILFIKRPHGFLQEEPAPGHSCSAATTSATSLPASAPAVSSAFVASLFCRYVRSVSPAAAPSPLDVYSLSPLPETHIHQPVAEEASAPSARSPLVRA